MDDSYKTMKLLHVSEEGFYSYKGMFQCEVCHGVVYDKDDVSPFDDGSVDSRVSEMTCKLCDENAPLSERYWMGLTTLSYAASPRRKSKGVYPEQVGFPSFRWIHSAKDYEDGMMADFEYGGVFVLARSDQIKMESAFFDLRKRWLPDILDGKKDEYSRKALALELVDRVRHDLKLKYAKEA